MFTLLKSITSFQIYVLLVLSVFLTGGVVVRLYLLGSIPSALYWDEVAMLADARMLLQHGTDLHGKSWLQSTFVSYGDYKLPVYIWMTTISAKLVGITPLAVRLPSMIAGLLTVLNASLITGLIMQTLHVPISKNQKTIAVAATAALAAVTPWSIFFSRTGFEAHLSQAIAGCSVVLLLYSLKATVRPVLQMLGVCIATLIAALGVYTYYSTRYVIPILFCVVIIAVLSQSSYGLQKRIKQTVLLLAMFILTFWISLQPILHSPTYVASNQYRLSTPSVLQMEPFVSTSNEWRAMAGNTVIDRVIFHRRVFQVLQLAKHIANHLDPTFLFFSGDANLRHGTGRHGILLFTTLPAVLAGWGWLLLRSKLSASIFGIWWFAALLPASVPYEVPHALRSLNALLPIIITTGVGYSVLFEAIRQRVGRVVRIGLTILLLVIPFLEFCRFSQYYFTVYPFQSINAWQQGYWATAETIYDWSDTHTVIIDESEERLVLWLFAATNISPTLVLESMQTYGPLPRNIGSIVVQKLEPEIVQNSGPVLLVGSEKTMTAFMEQTERIPNTTIQIISSHSDDTYLLLEYAHEN